MDHRARDLGSSRQTAYRDCSGPGLPKTASARDVVQILARVSARPADVVGTIQATLGVNQTWRAAPTAADRYEATTPRRTRQPHLALASNHPRQSGRSAAAVPYQPSE